MSFVDCTLDVPFLRSFLFLLRLSAPENPRYLCASCLFSLGRNTRQTRTTELQDKVLLAPHRWRPPIKEGRLDIVTTRRYLHSVVSPKSKAITQQRLSFSFQMNRREEILAKIAEEELRVSDLRKEVEAADLRLSALRAELAMQPTVEAHITSASGTSGPAISTPSNEEKIALFRSLFRGRVRPRARRARRASAQCPLQCPAPSR